MRRIDSPGSHGVSDPVKIGLFTCINKNLARNPANLDAADEENCLHQQHERYGINIESYIVLIGRMKGVKISTTVDEVQSFEKCWSRVMGGGQKN